MSEKYQQNYEKMREAIKKCVKEVKDAKLLTQKRIASELHKQEYEISNVLNGHKHDPELLMDIGDIVCQYRGEPWSFQQVYKDSFEKHKKHTYMEKTKKPFNTHDKIRFVIQTSPIVDSSLPEPTIWDGWDEAFKFCSMHNRHERLTLDRPLIDHNGKLIDYGDATILFLYEMKTNKVYTIYNYGKYKILSSYFLSFSLIPINPNEFWQCSDVAEMQKMLNSIVEEYTTFINQNQKLADEKPTYLIVADDGFDNHMVLNLDDNMSSYITGYKSYRQFFCLDYEKVEANTVNILNLPERLAFELNLCVDNYRVDHRCEWNRKFEKREHHKLIDLDVGGRYLTSTSPAQRIYERAVQVLNESFDYDIGHVDDLIRLEKLISQLEFTFLPYLCRHQFLAPIYHVVKEIKGDINTSEPNSIDDDSIDTFNSNDKELREFVKRLEEVIKEEGSGFSLYR